MPEFTEIFFSLSHLRPHQQTSSAFIIQVPLPQHRLSSIVVPSYFEYLHSYLTILESIWILGVTV